MTQEPKPPEGMIEVNKDQFFAALDADGRDIMPSVREPYFTTWETKNKTVWGWETPGWKNPDGNKVRFIYPSALAKIRGAA